MNTDLFRAYVLLQDDYLRNRPSSIRRQERYDLALDSLLAKPDRTGDPDRLVRNAWGNAGKTLRRRAKVLSLAVARDLSESLSVDEDHPAPAEPSAAVVEIEDWVRTSPLSQRDKSLLTDLIAGAEADQIAERLGLPAARVRVMVSRARARALREWMRWCEPGSRATAERQRKR